MRISSVPAVVGTEFIRPPAYRRQAINGGATINERAELNGSALFS